MKNNRTQQIRLGAGIGLSVALLASTAFAVDFAERRELEARSRRIGLGREEVTLYRRLPGPGRDDLAKRVQSRFRQSTSPISTGGPFAVKQRKDQVVYVGEQGWTLRVWADGTRLSYRNYPILRLKGRPVPPELRLAPERLEGLGREFIKTHLEGLAGLAPGEELVPLSAHYRIGGGGSTEEDAPPAEEEVLANRVEFARAIEGSLIVGGGSKLAILFTNDGDPVGFDLDWPRYESLGRTQPVLDVAEIQRRGQRLLPIRLGAPGVETRRFECGYFDMGARKRDAEAPLQSACFVQAAQTRTVPAGPDAMEGETVELTAAYASPIPAGVKVELDSHWPEALQVLGLRPPAGAAPAPSAPAATAPTAPTAGQ